VPVWANLWDEDRKIGCRMTAVGLSARVLCARYGRKGEAVTVRGGPTLFAQRPHVKRNSGDSLSTSKPQDRTNDAISLDEIERILI
jgi:hypothetical protein